MAINIADLIGLSEYSREWGIPLRTVQARARAGTLKHQGKEACWFKGGQWWVYRLAEHWPRKRGKAKK